MKLKEFKKRLRKEFNENYNDNKVSLIASKRKRLAIRLIPVYALALGCLALGIVFGIRYGIQNPVSYEKVDIKENESYRKLDAISKEELKGYINNQKELELALEKGENTEIIAPVDTAPSKTTLETPGDVSNPASSYETNNQVEGVVEADIAKFDSKYCYYLYQRDLYIYDLDGNLLVKEDVAHNERRFKGKLQVYENVIIVYGSTTLSIYTFDGSLHEKVNIESSIMETRITNGFLYVVSSKVLDFDDELALSNLYYDKASYIDRLFSIEKYNLKDFTKTEVQFASHNDCILYMNKEYIVLSNSVYSNSLCMRVSMNSVFNKDLEPVGVFISEGTILNQYSMDVFEDTLRVVSTATGSKLEGYIKNELTIFDLKDKTTISCLREGIGLPGETVKSVTFKEKYCFIVTYRNTDPLYEIDLTDPKNPTIVDELHIDGYSSYLKSFKINGVEYLFGAGYINNNIKYSIYINDENNTQVGEDFILSEDLDTYNIPSRSYEDGVWIYSGVFDYAADPHAMFFYQDGNYFYIGAQINPSKYSIFIVDINSSEVVKEYRSFNTNTETRAFLYLGKFYLPQTDCLIIEYF